MSYTLEEAMEMEVSKQEAKREIARHCDPEECRTLWFEFVTEFGDREEYLGEEVLGFLGY